MNPETPISMDYIPYSATAVVAAVAAVAREGSSIDESQHREHREHVGTAGPALLKQCANRNSDPKRHNLSESSSSAGATNHHKSCAWTFCEPTEGAAVGGAIVNHGTGPSVNGLLLQALHDQ